MVRTGPWAAGQSGGRSAGLVGLGKIATRAGDTLGNVIWSRYSRAL
jgi:hypothetical protein